MFRAHNHKTLLKRVVGLLPCVIVGLVLLCAVAPMAFPAGAVAVPNDSYVVVDEYWPMDKTGPGALIYVSPPEKIDNKMYGSYTYGYGDPTRKPGGCVYTTKGDVSWGSEPDHKFVHLVTPVYGVWDLGAAFSSVVVFPYVDLQNDYLEHTIYGSNGFSLSEPYAATWEPARLSMIYRRGWSPADINEAAITDDDYVMMWTWDDGKSYRYIMDKPAAIYTEPQPYGDPDIDAIKGVLGKPSAECGWQTEFVEKGSIFSSSSLKETQSAWFEQSTVYNAGIALYGPYWRYQTFTPAASNSFNWVSFCLYKQGNPNYTVGISLYNVDGNHQPLGPALCSTTFATSSLTTIAAWYTYNFPTGYQVSAGTEYALVLSGNGGDANNLVFARCNTTDSYGSGLVGSSANGGTTWQVLSSQDMAFKVGSAGKVHVAYGGEQLYYAVFDGYSWKQQEVERGGVGAYCSLFVDSSDNPAISYYDTINQDLKYAWWDGTVWNIQTVDSTGDVGSYTSLHFDSSGNPAISYYDATNSNLKCARWNGTSWDYSVVGSAGWVGGFSSLDFDGSGMPSISYYDVTNERLMYAHWNGTEWDIQTVDNPGWNGAVGSYTSLAFDGSGNPAISYHDATQGFLKYAHWNGTEWNITTVDASGWVGEYSSLALDDSGRPGISYYDTNRGDLKYAQWNGSTWDVQIVDTTGDVGSFTSLDFDGYGNPVISYYDATKRGLNYACRSDAGWKTQSVPLISSVGRYTSLAFDKTGNVGISYYDAVYGDLKYARWVGDNWNWEENTWAIETVDSYGDVGRYTSLVFDNSGNPSISYYDATNGNLKYAHWNGVRWETYALDSTDDVGSYSSLAFDSSGNPAVSYYDATNGDLKYWHWNGTGWESKVVDKVGKLGDFGMYNSLAFNSSGNAAISYYDITNGDLKYARWNGTTWDIEAVDSAGDVGSYNSLAFDGSGNPAISYHDVTNGDLKYAHWNGTYWIFEVVDNTGYTGSYTSLAFDASWNPSISYHDATKGDLRYAHWNGNGWDAETVDDINFVGRDTSLAFDDCGDPVISYEGPTNGDLKYAHPENPPPNQPTNKAPSDNAPYVGLTPVLESSDFSEPCTDSHAASQWRIATTPGECYNPMWDSGVDTTNLVRITIPAGVLSNNTTYYWQVRHGDCHGVWSEYSLETSFTTASQPSQPTNISPSNGALFVRVSPTLRASAFSDPQASDTHAASTWQITTTPGVYSSPVFERTGSDLTQVSVPSEVLDYNRTYYWHVQYQDNHNAWSSFSSETSFRTRISPIPPAQAVNMSPGDGVTRISRTPTLQSSPFSDSDAEDTHTASQWRLTTIAGDYSTPVFDSGPDGSNLTQITIPDGLLEYNGAYYWQVSYQDSEGAWSEWSAETGFTTEETPTTPPALLIAGAVIAVVILVGAGAPMMLPL